MVLLIKPRTSSPGVLDHVHYKRNTKALQKREGWGGGGEEGFRWREKGRVQRFKLEL